MTVLLTCFSLTCTVQTIESLRSTTRPAQRRALETKKFGQAKQKL